MSQPPATVASPCVRNCCLDSDGDTCLGCFRTLAEITGWQDADDDERRTILQRCARREADYLARHPLRPRG